MTNQTIYLLGSNGQYGKLDIEDLSLAETSFQIADINDITSRKDTSTTNITLKGTKNNNNILGSIFNLNRYSSSNYSQQLFFNFNFNKEVDCVLYENDSLIQKGLFKVVDIDYSGAVIIYNCVITGHKVNFFTKLKDKTLADLDFTEFNHTYSKTNIQNSWNNTTGYVYPLANYGYSLDVSDDSDSINKIDYKDLRPAFYLKEYINKIFTQPALSGYSYTIAGSTEFLTAYNKIVIPNNAATLSNYIKGGKLLTANHTTSQHSGGDDRQFAYDEVNTRTEKKNLVVWNNIDNIENKLIPNASPYLGFTNNLFTSNRQLTTSFEVSVDVHFETAFIRNGHAEDILDFDARLIIVKRTAPNQPWQDVATSPTIRINTNGVNYQMDRVFKLKGNIDLAEGSQFGVVVFCENYYGEAYNVFEATPPRLAEFTYRPSVNTFIQFGDDITTTAYNLKLNDTINFADNGSFATFKQQDFIKSFLNLFNLYIYSYPENPKHIFFEPYNDFYSKFQPQNLKSNSIIWSDKIDFDKWKTKSFTQIFKNYKFINKEDNDWLNSVYKEKYGEVYGSFNYENNTSVTSDTSIELIFAPTPIATIGKRNLPLFYSLSNEITPKQTVLRFLFWNGLVNNNGFKLGEWIKNVATDGGITYSFNQIGEYSSYPEVHTLGYGMDLNWNTPKEVFYTAIPEFKTLYEVFYKSQITEYNDANVQNIELNGYLNEIDIANLDFKTPIFIDSPNGSGYYKLLKADYSDNNTASSIELQKIYIDEVIGTKKYLNTALSKYASNPNCATSEKVFISVPAGKHSSIISQLDADQKAQAELDQMESAVITGAYCINTSNVFGFGYSNLSSEACSIADDGAEYYTSTGNLSIGSVLFKKVGADYTRVPLGYYSNGADWYLVNQNAEINVTGNCSSVGRTEYTLASTSSSSSACNSANLGFNLGQYYVDNYIDIGFTLYTASTGSGVAPDGFYSDAFYSYQVTSGVITSKGYC